MAMSGSSDFRVSALTSEINVTPMADIMLMLLIIFMITTPMLQEGIYVNMAKAQNPEVASGINEEQATTIALTRDDRVYFNQVEVTMEQLKSKLAEAVASNPETPMFVKGDIAVRYG